MKPSDRVSVVARARTRPALKRPPAPTSSMQDGGFSASRRRSAAGGVTPTFSTIGRERARDPRLGSHLLDR